MTKYYNLQELSRLSNIPYNTLRSAIRAGQLEAYKVGKFLLVSEKIMLDWLENTKVNSNIVYADNKHKPLNSKQLQELINQSVKYARK